MFAATSPDADLHFKVSEGQGTADSVLAWLEQVIAEADGKILSVVGSCSIHTAAWVERWMADHADSCEIFYQPSHLPEVNPVELAWPLTKREVSLHVSKRKAQIRTNLETVLRSSKGSPDRVKACFQRAHCTYILAETQ